MRGSGSVGRILVVVGGCLLVVGGVASVAAESAPGPVGGWMVVSGVVLIIAAVLERRRYRSEAADASGLPVGPGGGEPFGEPMETRFERTDEAFVDPTSSRRMRVWLDRTTGERRYRAED